MVVFGWPHCTAARSRVPLPTRPWQRLVPRSRHAYGHLPFYQLRLFPPLLHPGEPSCSEFEGASRYHNILLRQALDQAHERERADRGQNMPPAVKLEHERPGHTDSSLELRQFSAVPEVDLPQNISKHHAP